MQNRNSVWDITYVGKPIIGNGVVESVYKYRYALS